MNFKFYYFIILFGLPAFVYILIVGTNVVGSSSMNFGFGKIEKLHFKKTDFLTTKLTTIFSDSF